MLNKIAKAFNKAFAKNPKIHKDFLKEWRKSGYNIPPDVGEYSKKLAALTSKDNQSGFLKEVEELQGSYKNKGGKVGAAVVAASLMASGGQAMDMRNGGVVGMVKGGDVLDINIAEQEQFTADPNQSIKEGLIQATLSKIAKGEGTGDKGYGITFGYGKYLKPKTEITDMTLEELDRFQVQQIHATKNKNIKGLFTDTKNPDKSHGTSAVGKYQITRDVITDAVRAGIVNPSERFTPEVQEKIARFLLERSGLESMLSGKITSTDYRKKLSKVWASIEGNTYGQPIKTSAKELESLFKIATDNLLPFKSK
jgi:hypothetical protein